MAATVDVVRLTGAPAGTPTTITGINTRANAYDGHSTADTANPVQIPLSGSNYSFWVATQLTCSVTPAGTINNIRWYTDGTNNFGTGVTAIGNEATSYIQATGTAGQTGTQLTTGSYSTVTAPVDVFTFTAGAPKSLAGSLTNPTTGLFGSLFVYQLVIGATASPGASGSETFTYQYDET